MAKTLDHVAYLSREIGPRPAGTEEEQQAALYITEQLQKDAGLSTVIEDFNGVSNPESAYIILSAASAVFALASLVLSFLVIPAILIAVIAAVVMTLERFGRPVLSTMLSRGVSQNVVAQYKPTFSENGPGLRRRKVVLVARYDSGKVRIEEGKALAGAQRIVNWAAFGALVIMPVFLLIRYIGFIHADGALAIALNVIMVVIALVSLIPVFLGIAHKMAAYNEAANCNATGVAVMLDVASRIGKGRVSEAELSHREEDRAVIHGERAARAAGVVPEETELVYDDAPSAVLAEDEGSAGDRLAAAKAAVAALTGKAVSTAPARDISRNLVSMKEQPIGMPTDEEIHELRGEMRDALSGASLASSMADRASASVVDPSVASAKADALAAAPHVEEAEEQSLSGASAVSAASAATPFAARSGNGVPDWYVEAQKKAKRSTPAAGTVHRSRYADAFDAAQAEGSWWADQIEHETASTALSDQIRQIQDGIKEVKAPRFDHATAENSSASDDVPAAAAIESVDAMPSEEDLTPAERSDKNPAIDLAAIMQTAAPAAVEASAPAPASEVPAALEMASAPEPQPISFADPAEAQRSRLYRPQSQDEEGGLQRDSAPVDSVVPLDGIPLFSSDDASALVAKAAAADASVVDLGATIAHVPPVAEPVKQRAPLAEATTSSKKAAKSLLSILPSLSGSFEAVGGSDGVSATRSSQPGGASKRHDRAGMRTTLPSLSGSITRQGALASSDESASLEALASVSSTGSAGMTGAFAPVGEELLKEADPEDPSALFVEDADDSVFEENYTETGAFAGPGYVDMPTSRLGGFFGKFRHRKEKKAKERNESSAQEWLDVDEDFDAREVGKARGSWESFREEGSSKAMQDKASPYDDSSYGADVDEGATTAWSPVESDDAWDVQETQNESGGEWGDDAWDSAWGEEAETRGDEDGSSRRSSRSRRWHGGAFSRIRRSSRTGARSTEHDGEADLVNLSDGAVTIDSEATYRDSGGSVREEAQIDHELEQIYRFRNPDISTEVWFVALGSELSSHSGMKAFLAEHASDLRGAIIVELEGLGAGDLSLVERGGTFRPYTTSSRMSRYLTKASRDSGVSVQKVSLPWSDSSTAYAVKHGVQGMHLVGIEGSKPALASEADDVVDNVSEKKLKQASDFVVALLKNI